MPSEQTTVDRAKLTALREARGWSMKKLATLADVDYSSYWRIEKGRAKNPRHETVQKLARVLEVRAEELSRTGQPDTPPQPVTGVGGVAQPAPTIAGRGTVSPLVVIDRVRAYLDTLEAELGAEARAMVDEMNSPPNGAGP